MTDLDRAAWSPSRPTLPGPASRPSWPRERATQVRRQHACSSRTMNAWSTVRSSGSVTRARHQNQWSTPCQMPLDTACTTTGRQHRDRRPRQRARTSRRAASRDWSREALGPGALGRAWHVREHGMVRHTRAIWRARASISDNPQRDATSSIDMSLNPTTSTRARAAAR